MNLKKLRTDRDAERDGVWLDWQNGVRVKMARISDAKFQEMQMILCAGYADELMPWVKSVQEGEVKSTDIPPRIAEIFEDISNEIFAAGAIKDWAGIEWFDEEDSELAEEAKALPCTVENAKMVLDQVSDFKEWVREECRRRENFKTAMVGALVGNSDASSTGSTSLGTSRRNNSKDSAKAGTRKRSRKVQTAQA